MPATSDKAEREREEKSVDTIYAYNENQIAQMRKDRPWEKDVKHFKNCRVSALAAMKMLKHALSGVEKGRKAGTNPVEIMGLMIGKADGDSIIVLDACPLPVEGSETRVVADDAQVHMTELMDSMELRRKEGFIGWYHSHPFDLETYSHCHLSATDVQTQTIWQNASPTWTALVIDPLRSLMKQEPEFGMYRVYPPSHNPLLNQCPDGSINSDATSRTVRWGLTYHRYYQLSIHYFLSELGSHLLQTMSKNNLWIRVLSSSQFIENDTRARVSDRIKKVSERLTNSENQLMQHGHGGTQTIKLLTGKSSIGAKKCAGGGDKKKGGDPASDDSLHGACMAASEIAIECCKGHVTQTIKAKIFDLLQRQQRRFDEEEANSSSIDDTKMSDAM